MEAKSQKQPASSTETLPATQAEARKAAPDWAKQIAVTERGILLRTFDDMVQLAGTIIQAGYAPKAFDTVPKIVVCFEYGLELGFTPFQSLQSIAIINNRPCLWGDALPGLVKGKGKLEWAKDWFTGSPFNDDFTAHCELKRIGEEFPYKSEFSVADAKLAKLWGKTSKYGDPTPWVTYPKRMLKMRARGFAYRDGFADVLSGFGVAEEQMDTFGYDQTPEPERKVIDNPQYRALASSLSGKAGCENDNDKDAVVTLATDAEFTTLKSLAGNEEACGRVLEWCQAVGWERVKERAEKHAEAA